RLEAPPRTGTGSFLAGGGPLPAAGLPAPAFGVPGLLAEAPLAGGLSWPPLAAWAGFFWGGTGSFGAGIVGISRSRYSVPGTQYSVVLRLEQGLPITDQFLFSSSNLTPPWRLF